MEGMTDEQKMVFLLDRLTAHVNMIKLILLFFLIASVISAIAQSD